MLVTKRFEFSYAHILPNHGGKCKHLHGHNGVLEVTVSGEPKGAETYEGVRPPRGDEGMVIDFGDLKQIVKEAVVDKWDHRFLAMGDEWLFFALSSYYEDMPFARPEDFEDNFVVVGVRTTAENLAKLAFESIIVALTNLPLLQSVKFYETPDSWAEYTLKNYYEDHPVK